MKVFVTGATGYIGIPVVKQLLEHGHEVLGLARSQKSAELLKSIGAQAYRGDLDDYESLAGAAVTSDGVIHLGFIILFAIEIAPESAEHPARVVHGPSGHA